MDKNYNKQIQLRCAVCGSESSLESNDDKSYIKCLKCGREYHGGYNELTELNQELIGNEMGNFKEEITGKIEKDIHKMLKDAFKGNKNIKFR